MADYSNELIAKLKKAQSLEEVTELLKADSQDEAQAEKIWGELARIHEEADQDLSLDELEAVSGGGRNAMTEGCADTVKANDPCFFSDACGFAWNNYDVLPSERRCPNDDSVLYEDGPANCYRCPKCGGIWNPGVEPITGPTIGH